MAKTMVRLPIDYFPDPTVGRPIANGSIYIGAPDKDPEVLGNRIAVTLRQEDGTEVPILPAGQPLITSSGGVIEYNGSPVQVLANGNYSIKVLSSQGGQGGQGGQVYYVDNAFDGVPVTIDQVVFKKDTLADAAAATDIYDTAAINIKEHSTGNGGGAMWDVVLLSSVTPNGVNIIACTGVTTLAVVLRIEAVMYMTQFGIELNSATTQNTGLQIAFDATAKGKLFVDGDGFYLVDATANQVSAPDGATIEWLGDTSFVIKTNNVGNYVGLLIANVNNVKLISPFVIGDRDTHIDTGAENGHCIQIEGTSTSIHIINPRLSKSWGDGLYVLNVVNLTVDDCNIFNPRRNGISVISADGCVINGGRATLADGTNPRAGIDLEPNNPTQKLKGIVINDFYTAQNEIGISVATISMDNTSEPVDIVINNPVSFNENRGVQVSTYSDVKGSIVVNDPYVFEATGNGILIDKPNIDGPSVVVNDPVIIDNNLDNSTSNSASAGINIFAPVETVQTTFKMGNVDINNPVVKSSSGSPLNRTGINVQDSRTIFQGFDDIRIINPKRLDTFAGNLKVAVNADTGGANSDIRVQDDNDILFISPDGTNAVAPTDWVSRYSSELYTGNGNVNLSENYPVGAQIRFDKGTNAFTLRIVPTNCQTQPLNTTPGQVVDGTVNGSTITLEKFSATEWRVVNQISTWT